MPYAEIQALLEIVGVLLQVKAHLLFKEHLILLLQVSDTERDFKAL